MPPVCEVGRKAARHWGEESSSEGWAPRGCSPQQHTDQKQIHQIVWKCGHSPMRTQLRCAPVRGELLPCHGEIQWKLCCLSSTSQQSYREEMKKKRRSLYGTCAWSLKWAWHCSKLENLSTSEQLLSVINQSAEVAWTDFKKRIIVTCSLNKAFDPRALKVQWHLKVNSKSNRQPMERKQDWWSNVMSSPKTSMKPGCCILNQLVLVYASKGGVTAVEPKENECRNDFFQVRLWEHWLNSGDGSYLNEAGLFFICCLKLRCELIEYLQISGSRLYITIQRAKATLNVAAVCVWRWLNSVSSDLGFLSWRRFVAIEVYMIETI